MSKKAKSWHMSRINSLSWTFSQSDLFHGQEDKKDEHLRCLIVRFVCIKGLNYDPQSNGNEMHISVPSSEPS